MKKIYLLCMLLSMAFTACSVDDDATITEENLVESLDAISVSVDNDDVCNPAVTVDLCTSDVTNPTLRGFSNFYDAQIQVHTNLPLTGTYSPSMTEIMEQYNVAGGTGTFTTTYTVITETCGEATAVVSANVTNCNVQDPTTCGEDISVELCSNEIDNPTERGFKNFFEDQVQLHSDLPLTGSFSPTWAELVEQFNQSGGIGTFAANYTVSTEACGEVTIEVAATVTNCGIQDPSCKADDIAVEICSSDIKNPNERGFRNFFEAQVQLHSDLPLTGSFNPTMAVLVEQYNQAGAVGTFASNYTVATDCGEVTIQVATTVKNCQSTEPACDFEDIVAQLCSDQVTDPSVSGFTSFYEAQVQVNSDLPMGGSFQPSMEDLVAQYEQAGGIGTFTTNYTVSTEACGEVTIQVAAEVNDCE